MSRTGEIRCHLAIAEAPSGDNGPDARVARLAAHRWGVVEYADLRRCGLSSNGITARRRTGRLHRLYHGVYAVGHTGLPLQGRFLAAVLACGPGAVLSHFSAAAHYGVVTWDGRFPEVTVPGTGRRRPREVLVHRSRTLCVLDVTHDGPLPITSVARTLVDVADTLDDAALRRALREAFGNRLVTMPHLVTTAQRLAPRPGATRIARLLAADPAPTRSDLEDVLLNLIEAGGLARPDVNVPLETDGRRIVPDFRWPQQRLVVEADGAAWHDNPVAREDDARRQAVLEAHGERVLRVTWEQATARPTETLARLVAAGAPCGEPD